MNFFLHINRNFIIIFGFIVIIIFLLIIFSKQIVLKDIDLDIKKQSSSNADISEPKFAITNESKNIYISAKKGNFLNNDEILLKDNVKFRSNEFSIETNKVIFNRNKQTAQSKTKSLFKSKNTTISSEGFDIYEKGNKIIFYGKSFVILK